MTMKVCGKCKVEKDCSEFSKKSSSKDGLNSSCNKCKSKAAKTYRDTNKEIIKVKTKKYYQANKEQINFKNKEYRNKNKERKAETDKEYRSKNKESLIIYYKGYYQNNKEKIIARNKEYINNNKQKCAETDKLYYENNKQRTKANVKRWREANQDKRNVYSAKRRAAKLQRTPIWANLDLIKEFYTESARLTESTGIQHHVDHIIPLQGKLVSGLHVEYNLQILTATENLSKSNKYKPGETI